MTLFESIVVFLLTWWTALFAVLPWGVNSQNHDPASGHAPGAPETPRLKQKFLITTFVSALIWLIIYVLVALDVISFSDFARQMMHEDVIK